MTNLEGSSSLPRQIENECSLELTAEQQNNFELNRLRAKARQREKEQELQASSSTNVHKKRSIGATTASSSTRTGEPQPLKRNSHLGTYFEYDLSKMVNTKGGFLVEDGKEVDEAVLRKEKKRERQRMMQNFEPPIHLDSALNPKCNECQSIDIDETFKKVFGCLVCKRCQKGKPEKYSLLTKSECKEDYLLTDPELRDHEVMPHLLKANPHKSTYANMMLFLRCQVEEFAWKKWGSPEALDTEYEKRTADKKKKKNRKFEESLRELRKRTKEGIWQKRKDEEHKHIFSAVQKEQDGNDMQVCHECGFTIEFEEF